MRTKIINDQLTDFYRNRIRSNVKGMTKNFSEQEMDGMLGLLAQMNSFLDSKRVEGNVSSRRKK